VHIFIVSHLYIDMGSIFLANIKGRALPLVEVHTPLEEPIHPAAKPPSTDADALLQLQVQLERLAQRISNVALMRAKHTGLSLPCHYPHAPFNWLPLSAQALAIVLLMLLASKLVLVFVPLLLDVLWFIHNALRHKITLIVTFFIAAFVFPETIDAKINPTLRLVGGGVQRLGRAYFATY